VCAQWDTAGQERFRTITAACVVCSRHPRRLRARRPYVATPLPPPSPLARYYRGADGIILVYDVTHMESFEHVRDWLTEVNKYASEHTAKLLVGNKADRSDRVVQREDGESLARSLGMPFIETSARTGEAVEGAFLKMAEELIRMQSKGDDAAGAKGATVDVGKGAGGKGAGAGGKGGCC
jgi:Ras-related protein Rab-1A